jgi:hypothetical protein
VLIILLGVSGGRVAAALTCLWLAGCSLGKDDEPQPVSGAPKQIAQVISELDHATARRDYAAICDDLLTAAARRRAGGDDCVDLLRSSTRDLRRPHIDLLRIEVKGAKATARVRTRARGQAPIDETIELVRVRGGYRISALAD